MREPSFPCLFACSGLRASSAPLAIAIHSNSDAVIPAQQSIFVQAMVTPS